MKDFEKEYMLYGILKRVKWEKYEPSFIRKYRNRKFFNRIINIYGDEVVREAYNTYLNSDIICYENNVYTLTKKGKELYRRGWVESKINKYENPIYPLIISIIALFISIIGNENIHSFLEWIYSLF